MKTLKMFEIWGNQNITVRENGLKRISRWITIKQNYSPCETNRLWDYVQDENGYHPYDKNFNPENGLYLDYFKHKGRTYAIEQFYGIGSIADAIGHSIGYIENGEKICLSGFDSENYYNPLLVEIDPWGEKIRLYEKVR